MTSLGRGWHLCWRGGRIHLERGKPEAATPHVPMMDNNMDFHRTRQPQDGDPPAETGREDEALVMDEPATVDDGLLLEFPLQEHHHRIISTFLAEMTERQRDPSRDAAGTGVAWRPSIPGGVHGLAVRLKAWWAQRT